MDHADDGGQGTGPAILDDRGTELHLPRPARRVVSLVPSHSETVAELAGVEALVGVTRYCVRPQGLDTAAAVVGGTKDPDLRTIEELRPDLVLVNAEENLLAHIAWLRQRLPVYESTTVTLDDAMRTVGDLGVLLGASALSERWCERLTPLREQLRGLRGDALTARRTLYMVWRRPLMAVSSTTYIHHVLQELALTNLTATCVDRYPTVSLEMGAAAAPELVLLPDEPFPFEERHRRELAESWRSTSGTLPLMELCEGSPFCWYGVRTITGLEELIPWRRALEHRLQAEARP